MKEIWNIGKIKGSVVTNKKPKLLYRNPLQDEESLFGGYVIAQNVPNGQAAKYICLAPRMVEVCHSIFKDDQLFENLRPSDRKALRELIKELDPTLVESEV